MKSYEAREALASDSFVSKTRTDPVGSPHNADSYDRGLSRVTESFSGMAVGLKMHIRTEQAPEMPIEMSAGFVPFAMDKQKMKPKKLRVPVFQM